MTNFQKLPSLSLFFPSLNDAKNLPELIQKADTVARIVSKQYEIIVINDGSTDDTASALVALQKKYPRLSTITHKTNRGYGGALISGFKKSKYQWIFYTDSDGQYDPRDLTKLVTAVTPQTDVVNGYKIKRQDSFMRILLGALYNTIIRLIYPIPIRDLDCDFRLMRARVIKPVMLTTTSGAICVELISSLVQKGARFTEVPIPHYPRKYGQSEFFRWKHLKNTFVAVLRSVGK